MALTRISEDNITPGSITANSLNAVAVSVSSGEYANAAYNLANTVNANATSAGVYANAAFEAANNAVDTWVRDAANSASSYANSGFGKANTANTLAQAAFDAANNAVDTWVRDAANSASSYANSGFDTANSAGVYANAAFAAANTSGGGVSNASVYIYDTTVTSNIVLLEGQNGLSVGPITIANNVSINIASNSRWVVI